MNNSLLVGLGLGIILGAVIAWLYKTLSMSRNFVSIKEFDRANSALIEASRGLGVEAERSIQLNAQLEAKTGECLSAGEAKNIANIALSRKTAEHEGVKEAFDELSKRYEDLSNQLAAKVTAFDSSMNLLATAIAERDSFSRELKQKEIDLSSAKNSHLEEMNRANNLNKECAILEEQVKSHSKNLEAQKGEIERIQKELKNEFQVVANALLEEKAAKFTQFNKDSIEALLKPLGENIQGFRTKVEEVYDKESKERFSLGSEVQKLVAMNQKLSEEANSLATALKGNSKIQGDWGQMILENILERSGLAKGRDYAVQEFLKDADGNYLKNDEGTKMQPDVVVSYPDNRKVLIDAKASLTAYVRYTEAESSEEKLAALADHMRSIKRHIDELSLKSYQDHAASLDFVMMFIPNEPAYGVAMSEDPDLWHYAYGKKVILINPTNLIVALKMTSDIWRRENQFQNHIEIAKRGGLLYEKFVSFLETMKGIGANLKSASANYDKAFNQLSEGSGNLVRQAEMLRELGVKPKKNIPLDLLARAGANELDGFGDEEPELFPSS